MSMSNRLVSWLANKTIFEMELEKVLSHCPNMTDEDNEKRT